MKELKTGYAYHGNRMLNHAEADIKDMASHNCNVIVHMLSHIDWERHLTTIKELVSMSTGYGMEPWIDNWGLAGCPGDSSHFLSSYPEAHVIYSDGTMDRVYVCLNSPAFRKFTKEWIDAVEYCGCKKIFWDEPRLPKKKSDNGTEVYACTCPTCQKLFEEKYGYPMPQEENDDARQFQIDTIKSYLKEASDYSTKKGIQNAVCIMPEGNELELKICESLCSIDTIQDIGSDPYWIGKDVDVFDYVYSSAKKCLNLADKYNKECNQWIQTYKNPMGREEDIIYAAEALYHAGTRTILSWGYYGSISNDYRAKNPLVVKHKTEEAYRRLWDKERDRILSQKLKK